MGVKHNNHFGYWFNLPCRAK